MARASERGVRRHRRRKRHAHGLEMGAPAASGAIAEAILTVQLQPYPRRVLAVARRPA